ncbi:maltose alpha-D-glucosyltransferase / alpha-amylase [Methylacidimicrobium cyclopophantes]|uniref:maltose alpha-D-glucosyltransferase n=2 Tax=Methylacidimicrobium cyclopophantes TaxID=1041766 RepID=A0A5E6MB05_9BACT|nr:maltose alpha-D-glucosyltransferase / alpha-amylase [Methylacidimicrobium cyclopophantes]
MDAVIYEVHVKAFSDGNGDGIGDFAGLVDRLDYLKKLGITAIWLLPFYPSPLRDDGYDIADYCGVHPNYGTLRDFVRFLEEAHRREIRVITELVLNHTSDQHPWFQRARRAPAKSRWRNYYVWSDSPNRYTQARIIFQDFESSNWTWDPVARAYFWHRFYSHQPDLNYDNPEVRKEVLAVIDFWLGLGVDGLRLDAVPYLFEREGTNCENLPESHAFLKELRRYIDSRYANRMLLAEANQWPEDAAAYFGDGDECHMAFHFPVMPRLFMAMHMEERYPIVDILEQTPQIPAGCRWATFLRNHDELTLEMVTDEERDYMFRVYAKDRRARLNLGIRRRLAPLLQNNRRKIELLMVLLFSLPGTPILYYGDELGMGDNIYLGDRDGVRTPMQWSADKNAGFSRANPQKLYLPVIIDPEYHYETINAELEENNLSSLLWWTRRVIAMRQRFSAFRRGTLQFLHSQNPKVLSFLRSDGEQNILVVINLSRFSQMAQLPLSQFLGSIPEEVFGRTRFPEISDQPYVFTLGPYGHFWLELHPPTAALSTSREKIALLPEPPTIEFWLSERAQAFARDAIPDYLQQARLHGLSSQKLTHAVVVEAIEIETLRSLGEPIQAVLFRLSYSEGEPRLLFFGWLPVEGDEAERFLQKEPQKVFAQYRRDGKPGVLIDAFLDPAFRAWVLDWLASRRRLSLRTGVILAKPASYLEDLRRKGELPGESELLPTSREARVVLYEKRLVLKCYGKLEEGPNPDVEMARYLGDHRLFPFVPRYGGTIDLQGGQGGTITLCLLQEFPATEADAWSLALDAVSRFLERALGQRSILPEFSRLLGKAPDNWPSEQIQLLEGVFCDQLRLLARRTAEMHRVLAAPTADSAFSPEAFTAWSQRSLFQVALETHRRIGRSFSLRRESEELREWKNLADPLEKSLASFLGPVIRATKIRVHGDYHLGRLRFTGKDFVISDFEGEFYRPLSERRLKRPAYRDVASLITSLYAAASTAVMRHGGLPQSDLPWGEACAEAWWFYSSHVFWRSYREAMGETSCCPPSKEEAVRLLSFCLVERGLSELDFALRWEPEATAARLRFLKTILQHGFSP